MATDKWQPRVEYTFCSHGPYEINLAPEGVVSPDGTLYRWAVGRDGWIGPDGEFYPVTDDMRAEWDWAERAYAEGMAGGPASSGDPG
jgi:hypothetical protein